MPGGGRGAWAVRRRTSHAKSLPKAYPPVPKLEVAVQSCHTGTVFGERTRFANDFALLYRVRTSFPLHYIVFQQTASHLPHEGNSEQLFSRSGALSDPNGKMDPAILAIWTSIGVNYSTYQPSVKEILERYMLKFSKGGKATAADLHKDDLGLLEPCEEEERSCIKRMGLCYTYIVYILYVYILYG